MISVVFVGPAAAASAFKRLARVLGDGIEPSFHSMLLSTAALPDPGWSLRAEAETLRLNRDALSALDVPVYLPVASGSPWRMRDTAELLARVFPRARVEVFQGGLKI